MASESTTDKTGIRTIKVLTHVKIIHPRHANYGQTGTAIRIRHPHVWVALPGGVVVRAGHRSLEVVVPRAER